MTKLYRLRDRQVREVKEDEELKLRCLKRAGFVVGDLPALPKPKPPVEEKPLPPTEGEEEDSGLEGKVVLAEHEPVATPSAPLQEVKGEEAEVDDADTEDAEDAVAEDATEEDDAPEVEDEPEGKEEDGEGDGDDEAPEEGDEEDG